MFNLTMREITSSLNVYVPGMERYIGDMPDRESTGATPTIDQILTTSIHHGAADVHLPVGRPVMYRIQGELVATEDHVIVFEDARSIC